VRAGSRSFADLDVWVQLVGREDARQVTHKSYDFISQLTWTPDGSEVVCAVGAPSVAGSLVRGGSVVRVSLTSGGEPQPILGVGQGAGQPSIRGNRMVYEQWLNSTADIWRVPGRGVSQPTQAPARLIASSADDEGPAYSPDGQKIAFASDRSGVESIWVCDGDGSNPVQLTSFDRHSGTPRWSPNGKKLVFDSLEAGDWNVYVVDADGGKPWLLTREPSADNRGSWSHDGRFVYFDSDRGGRKEIWRIPSGGGESVQVTRGGGVSGLESPDGKYIYYAKADNEKGIWRVPVSGGEEAELVPDGGYWNDWALSQSGIYFMIAVSAGTSSLEHTIRYLDFRTGHVSDLYRDKGRFRRGGLAVSPGDEWILYVDLPFSTSELILIENFR
jgi:Tol biopolymer transport system component